MRTVMVCLVLSLMTLSVRAADLFWDGTASGGAGDGASDGGTATWNTSTLNWDQGNALNRVNWTNANNDTAIFGGTAGTVSLGTGITVGGLQFDTADYIVQNNTVTFGAAGNIVANEDATISSVITGGVTITKIGAGTLTLSGVNTYTGATIISNGTLKAGSATALPSATTLTVDGTGIFDLNGFNATVKSVGAGSAAAVITNSAAGSGTNTLAITSFPSVTLAPLIAEGAGQKIKVVMGSSGQGLPWLGNSGNTFSGGLTLLGGNNFRLWVQSVTTTTNADGSIKSSNLGTGPVTIGTNTTAAQFVTAAGGTIIYNPLVFNAAATYADGGRAAFRCDVSGVVLAGTLTAHLSPVSFSSGGSGSLMARGQITGPNGLTLKSSAITVMLSNVTVDANNYQGTTTIEPVTKLVLGANEQIPHGGSAGHVTNYGTITMNGFDETINGLSGTGTVDNVSGTSTMTVGGNDATSTFAGVIKNSTGTLSLVKIGSGVLTLSGVNTYTGATTISAGKLIGVTGGSCSSSPVTVVSGATLGARVLTGGGQWSCAALTLDSGTTTAEFDFAATPSTTVAPMLINGDLVNNGTLHVSILNGAFFSGATYPLIQYTGSLTLGTLVTNLPDGVVGTLVNNTTNQTIDLSVTIGDSLVWSAGTGVWDINTSSNWNNQMAVYTEGSNPEFDDTPIGAGPFTVTLTTNVNPISVSVNNAAKAYTIGGSGAITGTAVLTKSGAGILTLAGTNTYTGVTTVSGGTLKAGSTGGLSSNSSFSVAHGATLDLSGFNNTISSLSTTNNPGTITDSSAPGSGGRLRVATAMSGILNSNVFTGSMGLQIYGGNTVNSLLSTTTNTYSGGTIIGNGSGVTVTRVLMFGGTIGAGTPGALTSGIFGTGPITIGASTTDRSQFHFAGAITINNAIVVNSALGDGFFPGAFRLESAGNQITGSINANLADATFYAFGSGQSVTLSGALSGASGLTLLSSTSGGLTVTLASAANTNSYAGNTTIGTTNAILTLGAANQIPNGAGKGNVIATLGKFNMGGFSETINGLAGTGTVDSVSGTPTLTVGDNDATSTFAGVLQNSAGTLSLIKIGSGTLTLSGINTYNGDTTVSAGTLALVAPGSISSPLISIKAGATFDAGSGFTLASGQTLAGAGTVVSEVVIDGAISPGIAGIGTLTASNSVTWNAGIAWPYDLGAASASDRLSIDGDFAMGIGGEAEFVFDLQNSAVAGVYTLVTWTASTTFDDGTEFSAINIPGGLTPSFTVNANELLMTLTGEGGGFSAGSTNTSIILVSGQVTFGFNIASGALYHVQASTNLLSVIDNGFTNITGPLTNLSTATIVYTNTSSDPQRAFRITSP